MVYTLLSGPLVYILFPCFPKEGVAGLNSVQTRCIVKGEAQKSPLFWRFSGGFGFSQERLCCRNSKKTLKFNIKSPIFTNTPCKSTCLYNAPSLHTVDGLQARASEQVADPPSTTPRSGLNGLPGGCLIAFVTQNIEKCKCTLQPEIP